jgi:hypothetical protein
MKPITGQYECLHSSGVGLDYFTSRIDRLVLYPDGRFLLTVQSQSRVANAAQSVLKGQQVSSNAPEVKHEGTYRQQESAVLLQFDGGGFENAQLSPNGDGLQIGPNHFQKVSDSTYLPPTHRLQQNMDDIAKGLKIAGAIGGMAMKAAKTIQNTIQTTQGQNQASTPSNTPVQGSGQPPTQPYQTQTQTSGQPYQTPPQTSPNQSQPTDTPAAIFCGQCGTRNRPGKLFCHNCGARLD